MKNNRSIVALLLASSLMSLNSMAQQEQAVTGPVDWVNPLMGTDSKFSMSNGNVYPAIALPWGMNFWVPQTGPMGDGWAYQYDADKIRGFKQTHQPSPWMNDYGQFSLMPVTDSLKFDEDERASWFSHKAEVVKPYYYRVYLADADVTTEIAPTERAAQFRFTFPESDHSYVVIDAFDKGSAVQIIPEERKITGYTTRNSGGVPENFKNYFVIVFDKPFEYKHTWKNKKLAKNVLEQQGDHTGAVIGFRTQKGEVVNARVASSFISQEQAERNLQQELNGDDFEATMSKGQEAWNRELGKILVDGGTADQMRTFYSTLYRTLLFPRKFFEIDAGGNIVHYSPYNGEVLPGYMFTDTGFWDTFRALFPFLNLMYPSMNKQMQEGLANAYKEGGFLPEWASPGYRNIMIGNNSASVVADAWVKGLRDYDIDTLYQALLHGSEHEGPVAAVGRAGVKYYNELGYVPYDVGIRESAARTLEYAYDDFAIYQLAKALGRPQEEITRYARRSRHYRNLFDPETRLMRGKNKDGSFQTPFNPVKWGDAFTEGNSWHYTWSVFHDVQGLADLMGGRNMLVTMLDSVFTMAPDYDESYYGQVIHEIREMQVADMGQYAHGNQPIQHMIYLYNYAGEPWKAQYWARETLNRMYRPTPDGYCGDEDNGQTSAWYVFSALGFYPVCPAVDEYVLGAPLFKMATLKLENGEEIVLNAPENSKNNRYIKSVSFNGTAYTKNYLKHSELMKGAVIDFEMSAVPEKQRGTRPEDFPYSFSNDREALKDLKN